MTSSTGPRTRRVAAGLASVCLVLGLAACDASDRDGPRDRARDSGDTGDAGDGAAPQQRGPRTTMEPQPGRSAVLPRTPPTDDAAALAGHVVRAEKVLRDPGSDDAEVKRAGEFEQLTARMLARRPAPFRSSVLDRLPPRVRAKTRAHVEAASLLDSMGAPVSTFPDWRIVEPPAPKVLLGHYRSAGRQIGVPWEYLAAVHLVETRMGRIRGVSTAGAQGPMQFLPTTWDIYGRGGDINDPEDAILAAARLLRANGAPGDMSRALWHYNPSDYYVGAVSRYARQIQRSPSAYTGYWHWRVLYNHVDGTVVLDVGYPEVPPKRLG